MKQQNKSKFVLFSCLAAAAIAVALTSCTSSQVRPLATTERAEVGGGGGGGIVQQAYFTFNSDGPTLTNCVGQCYGCFELTNGASFWFKAPTNVTAGTFCTLTNLGTNINWSLLVTEKALSATTWCTNNSSSLTFPATYSTPFGKYVITNEYSFYLYVNTLTNSTITLNNPITLQLAWTTNN